MINRFITIFILLINCTCVYAEDKNDPEEVLESFLNDVESNKSSEILLDYVVGRHMTKSIIEGDIMLLKNNEFKYKLQNNSDVIILNENINCKEIIANIKLFYNEKENDIKLMFVLLEYQDEWKVALQNNMTCKMLKNPTVLKFSIIDDNGQFILR